MTPNALIYCRVSSDRQATEGHGLDGQERRCREYAVANGYHIAAVFRDEGASGGTIDRPALQAMFAYMRKHKDVDVVLFEDVSRIARDMSVHIQILSQITRLGAKYQTVNQPIEDTAVGKFIVQSLANVAELHRNLNAQNVKNRMKARLQGGYWVFENPPGYVYRTVAGHGRLLMPEQPAATIVQEALEGFASGRFATQATVRDFLQERGLKGRADGIVYPEQVRRILTQVLYAGHLVCPKWGIPLTKAQHEPLISLMTFDHIQELLAQRAPMRQNHRDMASDFPLRGFVLCGTCRRPYTASWSHGHGGRFAYYRCGRRDCTAGNRSVRRKVIEGQFETLLKDVQPRPEILELVRVAMLGLWKERGEDFSGLVAKQQKEMDDIDRQIRKFTGLVLETDSKVLIKTYEQKLEELHSRKVRLGSRIEVDAEQLAAYDFETALGTVFDFVREPFRMWKTGKLDLQRLVLRLVFREPLVYSRETGFETPTLSLPLEIATVCGADKKRMVELMGKTWNLLEGAIREQFALLQGLKQAA